MLLNAKTPNFIVGGLCAQEWIIENYPWRVVLPKIPARYRVPVFTCICISRQACHAAECKNPQLIVGGFCAQEWIIEIIHGEWSYPKSRPAIACLFLHASALAGKPAMLLNAKTPNFIVGGFCAPGCTILEPLYT